MAFWMILIIVVLILLLSIKIVPQAQAWVVEKLGSYNKTLTAGVHWIWPIFFRVAKKISLKEQVKDYDPQPVITMDNVTMQIDTVVFFEITDPKLYTCKTAARGSSIIISGVVSPTSHLLTALFVTPSFLPNSS